MIIITIFKLLTKLLTSFGRYSLISRPLPMPQTMPLRYALDKKKAIHFFQEWSEEASPGGAELELPFALGTSEGTSEGLSEPNRVIYMTERQIRHIVFVLCQFHICTFCIQFQWDHTIPEVKWIFFGGRRP